jgi:hypothetical protein
MSCHGPYLGPLPGPTEVHVLHEFILDKIMAETKSHINLSSGRSLQIKNTKMDYFALEGYNTNKRDLLGKSPKSL